MVSFSTDADILKYEPVLFGELHLPWQVLTSGTDGQLTGTTFSASGENFVNAQVSTGGVIYLRSPDDVLDGPFEIVSVDSATQLTVSVVRADPDDAAIAPPGATDIIYRISTFEPQAAEIGFQLTENFGIKPGNAASDIDVQDLLDPNALRRASAFAVISTVYAMLASKNKDENFWSKSLHYQKLFEKARQRCRLNIATDGVAGVSKVGASARLLRD
jgi:hypothetical protein